MGGNQLECLPDCCNNVETVLGIATIVRPLIAMIDGANSRLEDHERVGCIFLNERVCPFCCFEQRRRMGGIRDEGHTEGMNGWIIRLVSA